MKNNNPFNIRRVDSNKWLGKLPSNGAFEEFSSLDFGIRAGLVLLASYISHGRTSVSSIICRFAPPSENPTFKYISFIDSSLSLHGFASFDFSTYQHDSFLAETWFLVLAKAMIKFEGSQYADSITLERLRSIFHKYHIDSKLPR